MTLGNFGLLSIIESPLMVEHHAEQYKIPRSKKGRIRKKFAKKYTRRWSEPQKDVIVYEDILLCHPSIAALLRAQIKEAGGLKA